MQNKRHKTFCSEKFKKLLLTASVSTGIEYIMLLSDTIITGNIFGELAIAASNLVVPLFSFTVFISTLISCGTSVLYSYKIGEFKKDDANRLFGQGIILALIFGVIVFLLTIVGEDIYFNYMNSTQEVESYARAYFKYYRFIVLLYPLYAILIDMVYSDGDDLICNISYIAQVVVNIPSSIILCKKTGMDGASLGTLFGTVVSMSILLVHFIRKQNTIKFIPYLKFKDLINVAKYGLLDSSIYLFWGITFFIANRFVIAKFGAYYLPVLSVIVSVIEMTIIFDGVGQAISPLINVYRGEKNTEGIRKVMTQAIKAATIEGIVVSILLFIFGKYLSQLLGVSDNNLQHLCMIAIRFVSPFLVCTSILFLLTSYYLLIEKRCLAILITAIKDCAVTVILIVCGGLLFGLNGFWIGLGFAPFISLIITFVIISLHYGRGSFPLLMEKGDYEIIDFDLNLDEQSIIKLRDDIEKILLDRNVSKEIISRIMLLVEEIELMIMDKNPERKVLSECTIMIGKDIQLVFRDNGVLFDITNEDGNISSMRSYVVASMMAYQKRKRYLITTRYNRNIFYFEKEDVTTC